MRNITTRLAKLQQDFPCPACSDTAQSVQILHVFSDEELAAARKTSAAREADGDCPLCHRPRPRVTVIVHEQGPAAAA